jgi:galactose mutarotase-like enzyme
LFYDAGRRPNGLTGRESFDDVWSGGFEELFPNDAPGRFEGRDLPDHGELWNAPLSVVSQDELSLLLRRECRSVPARFEKGIALAGAGLVLQYRITNTSREPLHFLFKLHPAMDVEAGDRILLPGGRVTPVDQGFGTRFARGPATWPRVPDREGRPFDLSLVLPKSRAAREFVYVSDLPAGWCGIERAGGGERIIFEFPLEVFPFCWLFMTFGGWRDYYTVVLEPCTNMPKDLDVALTAGRCARLDAGATLECAVRIRIETDNA